MHDPAWQAFRSRCSKPNGERLGTWTAQKVARPAALRITRIIVHTGVSAHQITLLALLVAVASAGAFAFGTPLGWFCGALGLELWYVLDHVDGQIARWRGTASLDGTTLDYLMHHAVNLLIPQSLGIGLALSSGHLVWLLVGTAWSCGLVLLGVRHDARYKASIQRLKIVDGNLFVVGGGGGRPVPAVWPQPTLRSCVSWCSQKACEVHVLAHVITIIAGICLLMPSIADGLATATVVALSLPAMLVPAALISRDVKRGEAEAEFARWYRIPAGTTLEFRNGRYVVESASKNTGQPPTGAPASEVVRTY